MAAERRLPGGTTGTAKEPAGSSQPRPISSWPSCCPHTSQIFRFRTRPKSVRWICLNATLCDSVAGTTDTGMVTRPKLIAVESREGIYRSS